GGIECNSNVFPRGGREIPFRFDYGFIYAGGNAVKHSAQAIDVGCLRHHGYGGFAGGTRRDSFDTLSDKLLFECTPVPRRKWEARGVGLMHVCKGGFDVRYIATADGA